jgi:hypothetical protein
MYDILPNCSKTGFSVIVFCGEIIGVKDRRERYD